MLEPWKVPLICIISYLTSRNSLLPFFYAFQSSIKKRLQFTDPSGLERKNIFKNKMHTFRVLRFLIEMWSFIHIVDLGDLFGHVYQKSLNFWMTKRLFWSPEGFKEIVTDALPSRQRTPTDMRMLFFPLWWPFSHSYVGSKKEVSTNQITKEKT